MLRPAAQCAIALSFAWRALAQPAPRATSRIARRPGLVHCMH